MPRKSLHFILFLLMVFSFYMTMLRGERHYYLCGLLMILLSFILAFSRIESKKPKAKELVLIALLTAFAVVSRSIFIWLPHFKPIFAIVILSAVCFGREWGFLIGILSMFVSNFIFGHTPLTPWQMMAFGVGGYLAGFLAERNLFPKKALGRGLFGLILTVVVVGPLLDTGALFVLPRGSARGAYLIYLSGLPINFIQGTSVFLTLYLFSDAFIERIQRMKKKYGLGV